MNHAPPGDKTKPKRRAMVYFFFFTLPDFTVLREEEDDDFREAPEEDLDFEPELILFELVPREELRDELREVRLVTDLLEDEELRIERLLTGLLVPEDFL